MAVLTAEIEQEPLCSEAPQALNNPPWFFGGQTHDPDR